MADTARTGMHGGLRILLICSLALNLLGIGLGVGMAARGARIHDQLRSSGNMAAMTRISAAMPGPHQRELRRGLRDMAPRVAAQREAQIAANRALIASLRATPFDLDTVASSFTDTRARWNEIAGLGYALLLERIGEMSEVERLEFADNLSQPPRMPHERRERR